MERHAGMDIQVRVYEELNRYLPAGKRRAPFIHTMEPRATVEDLLEQLGIPCEEVELVLVRGVSETLTHELRRGDSIGVYPVFESLQIKPLLRIRDHPLRKTRFLVDTGLEPLGRRLSEYGYDTRFAPPSRPEDLVLLAEKESRILLTTRPEVMAHPDLTRGLRIPPGAPEDQAAHVCRRLDLS